MARPHSPSWKRRSEVECPRKEQFASKLQQFALQRQAGPGPEPGFVVCLSENAGVWKSSINIIYAYICIHMYMYAYLDVYGGVCTAALCM